MEGVLFVLCLMEEEEDDEEGIGRWVEDALLHCVERERSQRWGG